MMKLNIAIASLLFAGVAFAQAPAPKPPTPAPATPAAKPPAPAPAPAKPADSKTAAGAPATPPAVKAPEMPKPPQQIADMSKDMVGTWRCKGETMHMDGTKETVTATNTIKLDLNKWWIVENLAVKSKNPFTMTTYTTFDAGSNKWRRVAVDNFGGSYAGTSDGMKDKKLDWNLDVMGPMGGGMFRDHVDTSDAKAGVKLWGEMSTDKGKNFMKVYEMTCKK